MIILCQGIETEMDICLTTQIKCHIIGNQLTSPAEASETPSQVLVTALLQQISELQQSLPAHISTSSKYQVKIFISQHW
jgi:hypothetical protein